MACAERDRLEREYSCRMAALATARLALEDCDSWEYRKMLDAAADAQIDAQLARAGMDEHLLECAACRGSKTV